MDNECISTEDIIANAYYNKKSLYPRLKNGNYIKKSEYDNFLCKYENKKNEDEIINYMEDFENEIISINKNTTCNTYFVDNDDTYGVIFPLISGTDCVDTHSTYEIIRNDKYIAERGDMYSITIPNDVDTLKILYLKIESTNKSPITFDDLNMFELLSISLKLHIGNSSFIPMNFTNLLFQSIVSDVPIEYEADCIKIPLYIFNKIMEYGLPIISLGWSNVRITINGLWDGYEINNRDKYKLSIYVIRQHYESSSRRKIAQDEHEFLILKNENRTYCFTINNDYYYFRFKGYVAFLIFSIVPDYNLLNEYVDMDTPLINTISLKMENSDPMEFSDELILLHELGINMYVLPIDPIIKNVEDLKELFNDNLNKNIIRGLDFSCLVNLQFSITYDTIYSVQEMNSKYKLIVTGMSYNYLKISGGVCKFIYATRE